MAQAPEKGAKSCADKKVFLSQCFVAFLSFFSLSVAKFIWGQMVGGGFFSA